MAFLEPRSRRPGALARSCAFAAAIVLLPGCFNYHYRNTTQVPGDAHERWASFFLFGLVGDLEIDTRDFCEQREVADITTGSNGLTWLATFFTMGIYAPKRVIVRCSSGTKASSRYEIEVGPDGSPLRLTREAEGRTWIGAVERGPDQRYAVRFEEAR